MKNSEVSRAARWEIMRLRLRSLRGADSGGGGEEVLASMWRRRRSLRVCSAVMMARPSGERRRVAGSAHAARGVVRRSVVLWRSGRSVRC